MTWEQRVRPGYFGRQRDQKIEAFNQLYGVGNWTLNWAVMESDGVLQLYDFGMACRVWYEASYVDFLRQQPELVDEICTYGECMDNAITNIESGLDYLKQEAYSTHIQDIAVRNVLHRLGRKFEGPKNRILVIRGKDSVGFKFGPGNVPFSRPELITPPSLCPQWAKPGSVEDFWQSNKWLVVKS
jgi:hypothetical protein